MNFNKHKLLSVIKREIQMREQVYPSLVRRGKMTKAEAEYQTLAMVAVKKVIDKVLDGSEMITAELK